MRFVNPSGIIHHQQTPFIVLVVISQIETRLRYPNSKIKAEISQKNLCKIYGEYSNITQAVPDRKSGFASRSLPLNSGDKMKIANNSLLRKIISDHKKLH